MGNGSSGAARRSQTASSADVLLDEAMSCLKQGDMAGFRAIVATKPFQRAEAQQGQSILHWAARDDYVEACRWLIGERGYAPDQVDREQRTPLHLACANGALATAQYLVLDCLCPTQTRDAVGCTPLLAAVQGGHLPVGKFLQNHVDMGNVSGQVLANGRSCIHICAEHGHVVFLRWLVENVPGIQVDRVDQVAGQTAFHIAARFGRATILDVLLRQCDADPFLLDQKSRSALHLAAINDHIDVCRYLVEQASLDPQAVDDLGLTSVDYANQHQDKRLALFFLDKDRQNILIHSPSRSSPQ